MGTSVSDELIYTSAPRGIKPGSSGFCTVAATATLGPAWIERLELLSGYEPMYPLGDPREHQNPPIFRHLRITIAGRTRSVVSRIGYVPADHTGRSNKIAHHIVLDDSELGPAGPAWLMRQGIFQTRWSGGDPRISTTGPTIPKLVIPPEPASTWQCVTGDAGWAAVLADTAIGAAEVSRTILYPDGSDILALVDEAIRLLPMSQRWMITFDTGPTDRAIEAVWKWRVSNSGIVVRPDRNPVIDLTIPLKRAPEFSLSHLARTGGAGISDAPSAAPKNSPKERPVRRRTVAEAYLGQTPTAPPPVVYSGLTSDSRQSRRLWPYCLAGGMILIAIVATVAVILRPSRHDSERPDDAIAAERLTSRAESTAKAPTAIDRANPAVQARIRDFVISIEFSSVVASAKRAFSRIEPFITGLKASDQQSHNVPPPFPVQTPRPWFSTSTSWHQLRAMLPTAEQRRRHWEAVSVRMQQLMSEKSLAATRSANVLMWNLTKDAKGKSLGKDDRASLALPDLQKQPDLLIELPAGDSLTLKRNDDREVIEFGKGRRFWLKLIKVNKQWTLLSNFPEAWASSADDDRAAYGKACEITLKIVVDGQVKYTVAIDVGKPN